MLFLLLSIPDAACPALFARQSPKLVRGMRLLDVHGRPVNPFEGKHKAVVFLFIQRDCPISNRYAPEIQRLFTKFVPAGISFWLVYPDSTESVVTISEHLKEYGYHLGALRDPQHDLVKLSGVEVTPEAAVFMPGRGFIYRGRIDDRFVAFGQSRPAPLTRDLEVILERIIRGDRVEEISTRAIGCYISDLP